MLITQKVRISKCVELPADVQLSQIAGVLLGMSSWVNQFSIYQNIYTWELSPQGLCQSELIELCEMCANLSLTSETAINQSMQLTDTVG